MKSSVLYNLYFYLISIQKMAESKKVLSADKRVEVI